MFKFTYGGIHDKYDDLFIETYVVKATDEDEFNRFIQNVGFTLSNEELSTHDLQCDVLYEKSITYNGITYNGVTYITYVYVTYVDEDEF